MMLLHCRTPPDPTASDDIVPACAHGWVSLIFVGRLDNREYNTRLAVYDIPSSRAWWYFVIYARRPRETTVALALTVIGLAAVASVRTLYVYACAARDNFVQTLRAVRCSRRDVFWKRLNRMKIVRVFRVLAFVDRRRSKNAPASNFLIVRVDSSRRRRSLCALI